MPAATMLANNPPGSPELTLIRNYGYPISGSSNSSGSNSSNNNNYDRRKIQDNNGSSDNNGGDFKNVLSCGGKKNSRGKRVIVDLTWRRGKVGDKDHEYQRF